MWTRILQRQSHKSCICALILHSLHKLQELSKKHRIVLQCENGKGAERRSYQSQDATSTSIVTCNSAYNERWTYSDQQYGSIWHPETGTTSTIELRETSIKQFQIIIPNNFQGTTFILRHFLYIVTQRRISNKKSQIY